MQGIKKKYGIWGGRFQIIHKGHEYVLRYTANNFSHVCIGVVNPNPEVPAWNILEHEKFEPKKNPFTYFQRAYLWNKLIRSHSIDAIIVPHWHPRKSLKLESTFLPQPRKSREWVIPRLPDEEYKIADLEKLGEKVHILQSNEEPFELRTIHASETRHLFDNKDSSFRADIPEKIVVETEAFLSGKGLEDQFLVVPIIKDNLHPLLFCSGIQLSADTGRTLILAPLVNVQDETRWWEFEPRDDDSFFTFYQKHEIINALMKSVHFYDYMVVPIFVKSTQFEAVDAFLPESDSRAWLFIKGINSNLLFKQYLSSETILEANFKAIPTDIFLTISTKIFNLYNQSNYYNYYDESEEDEMPKNDFSNMFVSGDFINADHVTMNKHYNGAVSSGEDIIYKILRANEESEFKSLINQADKIFADKTDKETQYIIDIAVKKQIDTAEKKSTFLDKVKQFTANVGNSLVAGLLLQTLKNLVF